MTSCENRQLDSKNNLALCAKIVFEMQRAFLWSKNSELSPDTAKFRNFLEKFPETSKIVAFPKCEPFSGNSVKKGKWNAIFSKFGYNSRGCTLFRKMWEMLFHSILEISENSSRNLCWNIKPHQPPSRSI